LRSRCGDPVSLDHLLDAEARQEHLASVRNSASGYREHDRTGSDGQSGRGCRAEHLDLRRRRKLPRDRWSSAI